MHTVLCYWCTVGNNNSYSRFVFVYTLEIINTKLFDDLIIISTIVEWSDYTFSRSCACNSERHSIFAMCSFVFAFLWCHLNFNRNALNECSLTVSLTLFALLIRWTSWQYCMCMMRSNDQMKWLAPKNTQQQFWHGNENNHEIDREWMGCEQTEMRTAKYIGLHSLNLSYFDRLWSKLWWSVHWSKKEFPWMNFDSELNIRGLCNASRGEKTESLNQFFHQHCNMGSCGHIFNSKAAQRWFQSNWWCLS